MLDWFFKGNKQMTNEVDAHKATTKVRQREWLHSIDGHVVHIRKKANMKRLVISVKRDGKIFVSAPNRVSLSEIHLFIDGHKEWIQRSLEKIMKEKMRLPEFNFVSGDTVHWKGQPYRLVVLWKNDKDQVVKSQGQLTVQISEIAPFDESTQKKLVQERLQKFYKNSAVLELPARLSALSERTGWEYASFKLKNLKSMWGSCSSRGDIYLSWRLMVFDEQVIDYVIIHELAHTLQMNHSAKFWSHVIRFCPNHKDIQKRLKAHQHLADFLITLK